MVISRVIIGHWNEFSSQTVSHIKRNDGLIVDCYRNRQFYLQSNAVQ